MVAGGDNQDSSEGWRDRVAFREGVFTERESEARGPPASLQARDQRVACVYVLEIPELGMRT